MPPPLRAKRRTPEDHVRLIIDFAAAAPLASALVKAKSDVAGVTMDVINMLEKQSGWPLLVVRTDNGSEYINSTLATFFKEKGVIHQTTVRYTPEQNGKAERLNRTLLDRVRAMLEDSKLPKTLWAEAATTASYLRNRAPAAGRSCTPWEAFFGNKPDVSHLRVFGARAYALQPKELRRKLDSHAILEEGSQRGVDVLRAVASKPRCTWSSRLATRAVCFCGVFLCQANF